MCGNRQELMQVYLGCDWIGAVTVPINTASRGAQLAHILANSEVKLLVLQAEFADAVDALEVALPSLRGDDVLLTTLPLFHTNELNTFYQALLTGAALLVEPRFSASGFAASLSRHGANVTYLLGAMVPILLSRPASELDRAHHARVALGPGVPERFHPEFLERFGIELLDGYGSTETNFVWGCTLPGQRPGTMCPVVDGFVARGEGEGLVSAQHELAWNAVGQRIAYRPRLRSDEGRDPSPRGKCLFL